MQHPSQTDIMLEKTTERNVCYMDKYQPRAVDGVGGGAVVKTGTSWSSLIQAPFHGDCAFSFWVFVDFLQLL